MADHQLSDFRHLASDEQYANVYVGERLVAHIARARVYDPDRRSTITFYHADRTTDYTNKYRIPRFFIKEYARKQGLI